MAVEPIRCPKIFKPDLISSAPTLTLRTGPYTPVALDISAFPLLLLCIPTSILTALDNKEVFKLQRSFKQLFQSY